MLRLCLLLLRTKMHPISILPSVFSCLVGYLPALGRDEVAPSRRIGQQLWKAPLQDMGGQTLEPQKTTTGWVIKSPVFFFGARKVLLNLRWFCVESCFVLLFFFLRLVSISSTLQDILGDSMCQTLFLWCINVSTNKIEIWVWKMQFRLYCLMDQYANKSLSCRVW